MSTRQPRYSAEDAGRRGREIFERKVAPTITDENPYAFVGIDIETEDFEIDEDKRAATERLFARNPDAQIWMRRVGFPVTDWIGSAPPSDKPRWRKIS
jgi:hypothetical protein